MRKLLLIFAVVATAVSVVDAQEPRPAASGADAGVSSGPLPARVGVEESERRPLTVAEAIEAALGNAKDLTISRQNSRIAEFDLRAAEGAYDPRIAGQTFFDSTKTPNISIFSTNQSTTNRTLLANAGIQGLVGRFGTSYSTGITSQRLTTDNPISILSPQTNTNVNFSLLQPILRGRTIDQPRRGVRIAKSNQSLSDAQLRVKAIETVTFVQRTYWDLVFTLRNLQVQNEAVRDARRQLAHLRRLVEEGQLAPSDALAAETQVALLEQAVFEATDLAGRAENALKNLIAKDKDDAVWRQSIVPTEMLTRTAPAAPLEASVAEALSNRPEISVLSEQKNINDIEQGFLRDQTRPQLDLSAAYTSSGVGGSANPRFDSPFPSPCQTNPTSASCLQQLALLNGLTGSSFADVVASRYPSFRVGLTFSFSVGRKTVEAQLGKARVQGEQLQTQLAQVEQFIQIDVRNAIQGIRTAESKLRAATVARENSQKQYESEQRRLDAGQSDVYRVLERQTALVAAQSAEVRAQTEVNKAIAEYERAVGRTLEIHNITLK